MDDILIEKIKSALGIAGDVTDVRLMEKLSKARSSSHPANFQDLKIKEKKRSGLSFELKGAPE